MTTLRSSYFKIPSVDSNSGSATKKRNPVSSHSHLAERELQQLSSKAQKNNQ